MTNSQMLRFSKQIERLAAKADNAELTLPNGAIIGNLLYAIATDIAQAADKHDSCSCCGKKSASLLTVNGVPDLCRSCRQESLDLSRIEHEEDAYQEHIANEDDGTGNAHPDGCFYCGSSLHHSQDCHERG